MLIQKNVFQKIYLQILLKKFDFGFSQQFIIISLNYF